MPDSLCFLMAGGGTGGHVIPALAVARELQARGHRVFFVGTERGMESRLVPDAGFELEKITIGGIQGLGPIRKVTSMLQLVSSTAGQYGALGRRRPGAVFSMGGYVAGPPMIAALLRGIPVVVMEPNAMPGLTNRWLGGRISRALLSFPESAKWFAQGRTELTGLPVREEFFRIPRKIGGPFTVLITGGSQGSRTLNNAARAAWPLFAAARTPVRVLHQAGRSMADEIAREFAASGLEGVVTAFIADMPNAFAEADLVICRSGAGSVAELAAAGKPSVLIPFPFATDDHQFKNAQAMARAGAAELFVDREWTGERLFEVVERLRNRPDELNRMAENARSLARPGAAARAAEILESFARKSD